LRENSLGAGKPLTQSGPVAETRIELTGRKAIAALAVILAVAGIRLSMRFPAIPDDGRETVRMWLVND
jgi:hypothetical protein